jgi:hypothetical protein
MLCGLHVEFKDLVTSLVTKAEPLSYADLHSHLLNHEFLHKNSLYSWMQTHLCCHHLYYRSQHYCQHPLPILLHLITSLVSVVTGDVLVETSIPTATVTIIKTCPQLLPTGGRTNGSKMIST